MTTKLTRCICTVLMCFTLTSCLPGKKKEERVIEKAVIATQEVQAEKTAADMINAAEALSASTEMEATTSTELRTLRCTDGRIVAFIPSTSKLAKNGELSMTVAQRIRDQLQTQFKPESVSDADAVSTCGGDPQIVALNAPVLILDSVSANLAEVKEDTSEVVSIDMRPCDSTNGKRVPGVVVVKTFRNGNTTTEQRCGTAAPKDSDLPNIELAEGTMVNWKAQLTGGQTGGSGTDPYINFTCIAGDKGCTPINAETGTKVICPDAPEKRELLANPIFDRGTYEFIPEAAQRDCGKGWTGELVARVKKKVCQVVRNGVAEEQPASVYDIAYVGAKCMKKDVVTQESCPAGSQYLAGGHVQKRETLIMNQPIALSPYSVNEKKQNISKIGYSGNDGKSNINEELRTLITRPNPIAKASGMQSEQMFAAQTDLSGVSSDSFDQTYVTQLRSMGKLTGGGDMTCFAKGQDCSIGDAPANMEIIVDRTQPMAASISEPVYDTQTTCHATMANLFSPNNRGAACVAALDWQKQATASGLIAKIVNGWNYAANPYTQAATLLTSFKATLPAASKKELDDLELKMVSSLNLLDYRDKLIYGLAVGQDCNPQLMANGKLKLQEDMYGSCMPYNPNATEVASGMFSGNKTYNNFQTSCPGVCVTKLNSPTPLTTRIDAADTYMNSALIPRLPGKAIVNYTEVHNDNVINPVVLVNGGNATNSAYVTQAAIKVLSPLQSQSATGPVTPIFKSIDDAIYRLRKTKLDANPSAPATIIVFGSQYDTKCEKTDGWLEGAVVGLLLGGPPGSLIGKAIDSKTNCKQWYESPNFGRNFCTPERVPSGYECKYCRNSFRRWNPFNGEYVCTEPGFLRESKTIKMSELRYKGEDGKLSDKYPINNFRSREKWCRDNEFKKGCVFGLCALDYRFMKIEPIYQGNNWDNDNSLVGFLGRTYPNVKVYYFDFQGEGIGKMCQNDPKKYDPNKDHVFYKGKQQAYTFEVADDINGKLSDALKAVTGGGEPDDEVGKKICQEVFGSAVNIDYGIPPVPLPPRNGSFESKELPKGEGLLGYKDSVVKYTKPLVSSVTSVKSLLSSSTCIDGVRPYTLIACK